MFFIHYVHQPTRHRVCALRKRFNDKWITRCHVAVSSKTMSVRRKKKNHWSRHNRVYMSFFSPGRQSRALHRRRLRYREGEREGRRRARQRGDSTLVFFLIIFFFKVVQKNKVVQKTTSHAHTHTYCHTHALSHNISFRRHKK